MPILGSDVMSGETITLSPQARRQGVYVIGTPGTGKTTLLQNIAVEDMQAGEGLCVLDPHGDLTDELLLRVPQDRRDDVILFDPMDLERPFGLNLLECDQNDPHQVRWVVSTVMGTLQRLFYYSWGPRLEHVLRHSLLTAMILPRSTFLELVLLLSSDKYRQRVTSSLDDHMLKNFWKSFPKNERLQYELTSSTLNKVSPFLTDTGMRNIIGQPTNSFNMQEVMDEGKILLVNLSKGDLGEDNSALLGSVLVNLILIAALRRRSIPYDKRRPFHLIVDEFQNFATESFAILQSEARKYAVDIILAHQFRDQLDEKSKGSTLNVTNFVIMRVSGKDSLELASQFDNTPPEPETRMEQVYQEYDIGDESDPFFVSVDLPTGAGNLYQELEQPRRPYSDVEREMANRLSTLPNYEAMSRLIDGGSQQEYLLRTYEPRGSTDPEMVGYIRERSKDLYGRDRRKVEADISQRIGEIDTDGALFPLAEDDGDSGDTPFWGE